MKTSSQYGRLAPWRHPGRGLVPRVLDVLANSRLLSALLEPLPELEMVSDVTEVVYVNYLIPAERAAALVEPGLELQRLGPEGKWALFTFLTFQHGHFGFRFLGPWRRRLCPSPVQTNWRIHVRNPRTGHVGIQFLTNAVSNPLVALAARLFTEGMPMHLLHKAQIARTPDGITKVNLDPGTGSAPDAELRLHMTAHPQLDGPWRECWETWPDFLAYCVPQDRALSSQPWRRRISRQEIHLGVPLEDCEPVTGTVRSRAAQVITEDSHPLCFRVARVSFRFEREAHDSILGVDAEHFLEGKAAGP